MYKHNIHTELHFQTTYIMMSIVFKHNIHVDVMKYLQSAHTFPHFSISSTFVTHTFIIFPILYVICAHSSYCCNIFRRLFAFVIYAKYMTIHYTFVQIVDTYSVLSSFVNDSQLCVFRYSFNTNIVYM